jgi:hypothetical protein
LPFMKREMVFQQCVLYPNDLAMLQRVFDELSADGGHDVASLDAEMIAAALLGLFQDGVTEEAALLAKIRSRRRDCMRLAG